MGNSSSDSNFVSWKSVFSTLRMRMFLGFGLLFVAVLVADQAIEKFGMPFSSFEGRHKEQQLEAFRALGLTADLKKERLLLWIGERKADSKVISESPLIQSSLARVENIFHSNTGAGITGKRLWEAIRKATPFRELTRHMDVMMASYIGYDRIDFIDLHSGVVMVSTNESELGSVIFDEDVNFSKLSPT